MAEIVIKIDVDKEIILNKLEKFKQEMRTGLTPAWERIGRTLVMQAKAIAPVDTGRLKRNIKANANNFGVYANSQAIDPTNNYNYAAIQHFGGFAGSDTGFFKGGYIRGKFYMTIPLGASSKYVPAYLSEEIAVIIKRCGL